VNFDKEVLRGHIDTMILSLLDMKDTYGYELAKLALEVSSGNFELKEGTMYLALKRLEKSGEIESYWGDDMSGGGRRKYYKILQAGRNKLDTKRKEWEVIKKVMDAFFIVKREDDKHDERN
jgi:PadR family transcriptional regulator PadR